MNQGLAPCEAMLASQPVWPPEYYDASWEVGRLVLAPQYRSGPEALKRCLFLTLLYLVRNVEIRNLFASCSPVLGRLYRRFGFSVLMKDAALDGSASPYSLIHGLPPSVLMALSGSDEERLLAQHEFASIR